MLLGLTSALAVLVTVSTRAEDWPHTSEIALAIRKSG